MWQRRDLWVPKEEKVLPLLIVAPFNWWGEIREEITLAAPERMVKLTIPWAMVRGWRLGDVQEMHVSDEMKLAGGPNGVSWEKYMRALRTQVVLADV